MDDRPVLVTGGDQPVGGAIATALADEGRTVVVGGTDGEHLDALTDETPGVTAVRADPRDEFDLERLAEAAARAGDRLGAVVPAARVSHVGGETAVTHAAYAAVDDELRTNLRGVFATVREAAPHCDGDTRVLVPLWTGDSPSGMFAAGERAIQQLVGELASSTELAVAGVDLGLASQPDPSELDRAVAGVVEAIDAPVASFDGRVFSLMDRQNP